MIKDILLELETKLSLLTSLKVQNDQEEIQLKEDIIKLQKDLLQAENEEAQRAEKRKEEIKTLYESIPDIYYAAKKIEEDVTNPGEYLKQALESLDDTKLLQLKSAYEEDLVKIQDSVAQEKFERNFARVNLSLLSESQKSHPRVQKYIQKQQELISSLLGEGK
jgi:hypothetical protein